MLIDTGITIAYKCSSCGSYEFLDISYFKLLGRKNYRTVCRCGNSGIYISEENSRSLKLRFGCIGCGGMHTFNLSRKEIINKGLNIFTCPHKGIHQCFIGRGDMVRSEIDNYEKQLDELIDMLGYDSYFKNTRVMYDSLNKIHDAAEQGNLICECGNEGIELNLLSDSIHILCRKCHTDRIVKAATSEDLKELIMLGQIRISENCDMC